MIKILRTIRENIAIRRIKRLPEEEKEKLMEALVKLAIGIESNVTVFELKLEEKKGDTK